MFDKGDKTGSYSSIVYNVGWQIIISWYVITPKLKYYNGTYFYV